MRKRLKAQIGARKKQGVFAGVETMDDDLEDVLRTQIEALERADRKRPPSGREGGASLPQRRTYCGQSRELVPSLRRCCRRIGLNLGRIDVRTKPCLTGLLAGPTLNGGQCEAEKDLQADARITANMCCFQACATPPVVHQSSSQPVAKTVLKDARAKATQELVIIAIARISPRSPTAISQKPQYSLGSFSPTD